MLVIILASDLELAPIKSQSTYSKHSDVSNVTQMCQEALKLFKRVYVLLCQVVFEVEAKDVVIEILHKHEKMSCFYHFR